MNYFKRGNFNHMDFSTIMKNAGAWGEMKFTRKDGKVFVLPPAITNSEKETIKVMRLLNAHDEETEAKYILA